MCVTKWKAFPAQSGILVGCLHRRFRRGFTVIELLTVVSVISLLLSLLLPAVLRVRESARLTNCRNQLRQLGLALHHYESIHSVFPMGIQVARFQAGGLFDKSFGWPVALLPFIEQTNLYERFDFRLDCQVHHRLATNQFVPVFGCPSDPATGVLIEWDGDGVDESIWGPYYHGGWGPLSYLGVSGTDGYIVTDERGKCGDLQPQNAHLEEGVLYHNSSVRFSSIVDGTSNTFLFGERGVVAPYGKWGGAGVARRCPAGLADVVLPGIIRSKTSGGVHQPYGDFSDQLIWWSWHSFGTNFSLSDGSVKAVSYSVSPDIVAALSSKSGNELLPSEW